MVRMYRRVLACEGYTVETASNGQEGYEKTKTFKPDLILLDIMMPVLNGLQALEKLKKDPQTKGYKVVMLTNLADKEDAQRALNKGAIEYLIKSDHDIPSIIAIIEKILA